LPIGHALLLGLAVVVLLALPVWMLIVARRSSRFDAEQRALLVHSSRRILFFQSVLAVLLVAAAILDRHGHRQAVHVGTIALLCVLVLLLAIRIRSQNNKR
jgi:hypothetical protein